MYEINFNWATQKKGLFSCKMVLICQQIKVIVEKDPINFQWHSFIMQQQDIQVIKRIINFIKVDLKKNFWKLEAASAFPQIATLLLLSWRERKQFCCVAARYLFALLKCLGTQNWDQNLSLLAAVPVFHLQSKYVNMPTGDPYIAVLSAETWLVELHEWEAYLGVADGALLLYSQGIAHSLAGVCPWGVCFTEGALEYGGWADLHPRMAILPVASLGRNKRGWHDPEGHQKTLRVLRKVSYDSYCVFVTR